jgi:hypothetical protein
MTRVIFSCLLLLLISGVSCSYRKPASHKEIAATYASSNKQKVWDAVLQVLEQKQIPVARKDFGKGIIVSDSFTVTPDQVDCGKNFFGVDYPGTRLGVLKVKIKDSGEPRITFELGALLTITVNGKQVVCTSFGTLEDDILNSVDIQLGLKRDQVRKSGN